MAEGYQKFHRCRDMRDFTRTMKVIGMIIKISAARFTTYRVSTFFVLTGMIVWTGGELIYLEGLFGNIESLAGFGRSDMLLLLGISQMFYLVYDSVICSKRDLDRLVITFDLDKYLLKPINQMLFTTLDYVNFKGFVQLPIITGLLLLAYSQGNYEISLSSALLFVISFVLGCINLYFIQLLFQLAAFWVVNSDAKYLIAETWAMMRFPREVFGRNILSMVLTYIIPILLIMNVPFHALLGDLDLRWIGVMVLNSGFLYIVTSFLWKRGVMRYCDVD